MEEQTTIPTEQNPSQSLELEQPVFSNYLTSASQVLHSAGDELRGMELHILAGYTDRSAGWLQDLAQFAKDHGIERQISEVYAAARRRPELFIGGLLLAGFALTRGIRRKEGHI